MAIYKGREVSLAHDVPRGYVEPISMTIRYKDGTTETVKLSELQFTSEEKTALEKAAGKKYENINIIEQKDLQNLRDSQDVKKIEAAQKNQDTPKDVTIQATKATVQESPVKPVVKK